MATASHGVLYEGPSAIDGAPIVVIATVGSANAKTGDMAQVWILRSDIEPHTAKAQGLDASICGACPNRAACYVTVHQAPLSVFRAYKRGRYVHITPEMLAGKAIRWGAYGDPSLIPLDIVQRANAVAKMWTGYTHQWNAAHGQQFRGIFMASVESERQERMLNAFGWGTFRVGLRDGSDQRKSTLCASKAGVSCAACGKCDGRLASIYIPAHGALAARTPAEQKQKRRLSVISAEVA